MELTKDRSVFPSSFGYLKSGILPAGWLRWLQYEKLPLPIFLLDVFFVSTSLSHWSF